MERVPDATDGSLGGSAPSDARATQAVRASPQRLRKCRMGEFCNPLVAERGFGYRQAEVWFW